MKRILIVEDDRDLADLIRYNLEREGFQVAAVHNGADALARLRAAPPDLVILDLMLPGMPGLELCKALRRDERLSRLPVLVISARGEETDRVLGLELGADDYLTKPFSPRELVARVRALLRRAEPGDAALRPVTAGILELDPASLQARKRGEPVPLSVLEFRLLHFLATYPGRVFSREALLDAVWGTDRFVTQRSVDVYIRRLREKIEDDPEHPVYLKTVRGAGYMFDTRAD